MGAGTTAADAGAGEASGCSVAAFFPDFFFFFDLEGVAAAADCGVPDIFWLAILARVPEGAV